jgi:hypothetical protein
MSFGGVPCFEEVSYSSGIIYKLHIRMFWLSRFQILDDFKLMTAILCASAFKALLCGRRAVKTGSIETHFGVTYRSTDELVFRRFARAEQNIAWAKPCSGKYCCEETARRLGEIIMGS